MASYPNDQAQPAGATPVRLVNAAGTAFYNAGSGGGGAPDAATPKGCLQISAATLAAATGLTVPGTATYAVVQPSGGDVIWRDDGTAPTVAGIGMTLYAGSVWTFSGDLSVVQFILSSGQTPTLNISYYA